MSDPVIRIEKLNKQYETDAGPVPVLRDVTVSVMPGEFVAIMGPSGSGKSTLMNILGCLDVATSGSYLLNGRDAQRLGLAVFKHVHRSHRGRVALVLAALCFIAARIPLAGCWLDGTEA